MIVKKFLSISEGAKQKPTTCRLILENVVVACSIPFCLPASLHLRVPFSPLSPPLPFIGSTLLHASNVKKTLVLGKNAVQLVVRGGGRRAGIAFGASEEHS